EEDRWIVFEEAEKFLEVVGHYERWEPAPAKNRWIYVFGLSGGKVVRVWEVRTDNNGKFATYELTEDNYDSRPVGEEYEDVVPVPTRDGDGNKYTFYAALSEIRLPLKRIFDKREGLIVDPKKRCVNIDDNEQVARKVDSSGEEHVILVNYLRRAEELRRRYDRVLEELEELRRPSSVEADPIKKRDKLRYEFGGLLLQILAANPDFERSFSESGLKRLKREVEEIDSEKASKTGEWFSATNQLCEWIRQEIFSEVCLDYCALIKKGDSQSTELYDFESRIGKILSGLSRTVEGNKLLEELLREVNREEDQSWLQKILLLGNDVWAPTGASLSGAERFENIRSISDGLITLMQEAAISGIGKFTPSEMKSILNKVFRTTGESFYLEIVKITFGQAKTPVRPFSEVVFSFSENSFWRFEFPKDLVGKGLAARFLASDGLENCMAALNGISIAFNLYEVFSKEAKTFEEKYERVKWITETIVFMLRTFKMIRYEGKLVRIGTGPVALVGACTALFDSIFMGIKTSQAIVRNDYDAFFWGILATSGMALTAVGSGALAATYFAGAAATTLTGIGVAPALLMVAIGTLITVGASIKSERSEMELLIQKTEWGLKPEGGLRASELEFLKKHYCEVILLLSSFSVVINKKALSVTIILKRLEAETKITLHSVEFGKVSRESTTINKDRGYDIQIVGKEIVLNSSNCIVKKTEDGKLWNILVDIRKVCSGATGIFWQVNEVDFVRLKVSVDLFGDGEVIFPERGKMLIAYSYGVETNKEVG
ncbi:MAG: hypothetical protein N2053_08355, partial [Chitinispirillaceae bacterium]|nr:hypothetical protein [Chitinispirillaceae bacterium]